MKELSRRRFIGSVFSMAAVAGVTSAFPSLGAACRKKQSTTAQIDPDFEPGYLKLHQRGELKRRGEELWQRMQSCSLCPRECGAARLDGEAGFCRGTSELVVAAHHPHYGEERSLVGRGGSGTIFFSNCNLRCVFCINWQVSQGGRGEAEGVADLAEMMLYLQGIGCHNINIVTPTHYSAHIVRALDIAAAGGLRLPLVYNTCGWERADVMRELDGIVDIYLPDFKYADGAMASKYSSGADTYPEVTQAALLEMHRQVGVAKPAADGLMYRGLMIRHLVMPSRVSGSRRVIDWIAKNLPKDTYVNIMAQYRPMYKAFDYPEIARRLTRSEYVEVIEYAKQVGLTNLDTQRLPPA